MKTGTMQKKTTSLSARALLVSVNISQWAGRKFDQRATDTANNAHKADASAGNYNKKLLPGAKELAVVSSVAGQARKYFYEQTLPWMSDGTRIISGKNYLSFQTQMRKIKSDFELAVKDFESAYPRLKKEAKSKLGDLFNATEYPDDIREKFAIQVDFFPMPDAKDFRVAISDGEKKAFERKIRDVETQAMLDASGRLLGVVKAAIEKLKDPKAIFRDSLLENVNEVAALIPVLNISNDKRLDKIGEQAVELIKSIDMKDVRKSSKVRNEARKSLSDIEAKMGAFMGGLK